MTQTKHLYTDLNSPTIEKHDVEAINNAIRNILTTPVGTVPGMPEFGSRLHSVVFDFTSGLTENLVKRLISEAIYRYENRIVLVNIDIKSVPEYNKLIATMAYRFRDDILNTEHNFSINLLH